MNSFVSQGGIDLIMDFEGFRANAYKDVAGRWTIGFGNTNSDYAREGVKIDKEKALELLMSDIQGAAMVVKRLCDVPPLQHQLDAMTSLCLNIGDGNFAKSSVIKYHNLRDFDTASKAFLMWDKFTDPVTKTLKVSNGLRRRRMIEAALYTQGNGHSADHKPLRVKPKTKGLKKSRIIIGSSTAAAGTIADQVINQIGSGIDSLAPLSIYLSFARWVVLFLTLAALGLVIYARIDDHRKGK